MKLLLAPRLLPDNWLKFPCPQWEPAHCMGQLLVSAIGLSYIESWLVVP